MDKIYAIVLLMPDPSVTLPSAVALQTVTASDLTQKQVDKVVEAVAPYSPVKTAQKVAWDLLIIGGPVALLALLDWATTSGWVKQFGVYAPLVSIGLKALQNYLKNKD